MVHRLDTMAAQQQDEQNGNTALHIAAQNGDYSYVHSLKNLWGVIRCRKRALEVGNDHGFFDRLKNQGNAQFQYNYIHM